uniref:Uncharacterized protein n=1 Tax=Cannabis sativa TaxID=3483 RepID=A0A803PC00_CANSA
MIQGMFDPKLFDLELDRTRRSPFSVCINPLPLPTKLKMPTWKMYIGKKDPLAHIKYFEIQIDLQNVETIFTNWGDGWSYSILARARQILFKMVTLSSCLRNLAILVNFFNDGCWWLSSGGDQLSVL